MMTTTEYRATGFMAYDSERGQWYLRGFSRDPDTAKLERITNTIDTQALIDQHPAHSVFYLVNGMSVRVLLCGVWVSTNIERTGQGWSLAGLTGLTLSGRVCQITLRNGCATVWEGSTPLTVTLSEALQRVESERLR